MRCEWEDDWVEHGTGWAMMVRGRCFMPAEPGKRLCAYHAAEEAGRVGALRQAFGRSDGPCLPKNIKMAGEDS